MANIAEEAVWEISTYLRGTAPMAIEETLDELAGTLKELSVLRSCGAVLGWEEQTYMPPAAAEWRGEQSALISRLAHERLVSEEFGDLLEKAAQELEGVGEEDSLEPWQVVVRELVKDRKRALALSSEFVEKLSRTTTAAFHGWQAARAKSDFSDFLPHLEAVLDLKREEALRVSQTLSDPQRPLGLYDALLDEYEPGLLAEDVRSLFAELRQPLTDLTRQASQKILKQNPLRGHHPLGFQQSLVEELTGLIGLKKESSRLDRSTHPFCTRLGPRDIRITTRYDEQDLGDGLFSVLHEMGHALYEQGLPAQWYGTPLGDSVSLGIHESQSRFWENFIGRSAGFWRWLLPRLESHRSGSTKGVAFGDWMAAVHEVTPSYIRVDADEVTYNLHVLLRFELEEQMISGALEAREVPEAWWDKVQTYLGLEPKEDRLGCLQDVHWSGGALGYFPTYTLGNLHAACLTEALLREIPDWEEQVARGDFANILDWMVRHVHQSGRRWDGKTLLERATGRPLESGPLLRHLQRKVETDWSSLI
jgi:carboxypeptidase Taq